MAPSRLLFLLRHAKSSWDEPELRDHDRPLAPRGRRAAELMGGYLRREEIEPLLVLCSSAARARQTLKGVEPEGEVSVEEGLYGASAEGLLDRLRRVPDEFDSVMLIGHNPAMQDLALMLASGGVGRVERKFPSGALATLAFDGDWSDLAPGGAELVDFVRPKQLG